MDIVIPFRHSINRDEELRYALRSAEKFLDYDGQVWVVGDEPRWAHSPLLNCVPCADLVGDQWLNRNQANKLRAGALFASEYFWIMHDDNFLLQPLPWTTWYNQGFTWQGAGLYAQTLANTARIFGAGAINYDVHCPHAVHNPHLLDALDSVDWNRPHGYCIKSLYGNKYGIAGTYCTDLKVRAAYTPEDIPNLAGRPWFSIGDSAWRGALPLLRELYPDKSKYEV